jgi:predicted RNA-binding Zn-ribbon protein involved in translation (DUF1610 family)
MKNAIMLGVLIVLVIGAGFFFKRSDKEGDYAGTEGSKTPWKCLECGKLVELTAKQVHDWQMSDDKVLREKGRKQTVFWCPDCQKFTVVRADFDPDAKEYYCTKDLNGNWLPTPTQKKEQQGG